MDAQRSSRHDRRDPLSHLSQFAPQFRLVIANWPFRGHRRPENLLPTDITYHFLRSIFVVFERSDCLLVPQ